MYTCLSITPRRYPLLHGPSAPYLSIPFSVLPPSFYPSFFGFLSLFTFQLVVLIFHIDAFHRNTCNTMFMPFCATCNTLLSTWVPLWCPNPLHKCRLSSAEHVLFSILWQRCTGEAGKEWDGMRWDGMGQGERDDFSQSVSPRQGTAESGL